ncbi:hypothetical protein TNIN_245541 [Trichonephila inaurata madagascariensis]|uniref:C2H2-type domain-containing protein n=1 Tax=Trichonephila inaurata madagascariensis TaxID=2747483 RepID=A0A8X6YVN8_9ARAC|nr:hypothetical protein TNIN_245541 [Trichonephila inaurata madagascariensis]
MKLNWLLKQIKFWLMFQTLIDFDVHQTYQQFLHIVKHKKTYPCTFCEFVSPYHSTLKRHMFRKHFEERPHGCGVCGKRFVTKFDLNRHMVLNMEKSINVHTVMLLHLS